MSSIMARSGCRVGSAPTPRLSMFPTRGDPVDTTVEFTNAPVYLVDITPETFSSNLSVIVDADYVDTPHNFSPYYDTTWTPGSTHTLNLQRRLSGTILTA
jgi:hypothetical protein